MINLKNYVEKVNTTYIKFLKKNPTKISDKKSKPQVEIFDIFVEKRRVGEEKVKKSFKH